MSWDAYYQRKAVIDGVLAEITETETDEIPPMWCADITEVFGGEDEFLLALHYGWANTLNARLDPVLESTPEDTAAKVRRAWDTLAAERPATICLLARYAGRPALKDANERLQRQLSWAPGVDVWQLTESYAGPVRVAA